MLAGPRGESLPPINDHDGVPNDQNLCPGTLIQEAVPTISLGVNRWALVNDDLVFDTNATVGAVRERDYTVEDTGGCSCEQIVSAQSLGVGHLKFGCVGGEMDIWLELVLHP